MFTFNEFFKIKEDLDQSYANQATIHKSSEILRKIKNGQMDADAASTAIEDIKKVNAEKDVEKLRQDALANQFVSAGTTVKMKKKMKKK